MTITIWRKNQVPITITVQKFEWTRCTCSVYGFTSSVDIRSTGCKGGTGWHSFLELERKTKTGRKGSECRRRSFFVPIRALIPNIVYFRPLTQRRDCDRRWKQKKNKILEGTPILRQPAKQPARCSTDMLAARIGAKSVPSWPRWKWYAGQAACGADTQKKLPYHSRCTEDPSRRANTFKHHRTVSWPKRH